jgi:hypothetical protein
MINSTLLEAVSHTIHGSLPLRNFIAHLWEEKAIWSYAVSAEGFKAYLKEADINLVFAFPSPEECRITINRKRSMIYRTPQGQTGEKLVDIITKLEGDEFSVVSELIGFLALQPVSSDIETRALNEAWDEYKKAKGPILELAEAPPEKATDVQRNVYSPPIMWFKDLSKAPCDIPLITETKEYGVREGERKTESWTPDNHQWFLTLEHHKKQIPIFPVAWCLMPPKSGLAD